MVSVAINQKMTPEQFVYWLQGLLELSPELKTLNELQVKLLRQHLDYVFTHGHIQPQPVVFPQVGTGDAVSDKWVYSSTTFPPSITIC